MKTTKELAKELGLLRKRTLSSSWATNLRAKGSASDQLFKYLIVIDFESTCWQDGKFRTQEIIEFPAVLLNTLTGEVESEFHHYVQPQEQPTLSAFCTELTGITQDQVDGGIPVNLCLKKFTHWLSRLGRDKGVVCHGCVSDMPVNTTCVTWSDWDLGVCLQYECKRKQLLKPAQLTSWIDLRATYRKFYERKPNGLNGALQDLGIQFEGREHSGLDDARNTTKLAHRMIRDGCVMKVTKTLQSHARSASCNPTITSYMTKAPASKQASSNLPPSKIAVPKKNTPVKGPSRNKLTPKMNSSIASRKMTPSKTRASIQDLNRKTPSKVQNMSNRSVTAPSKSPKGCLPAKIYSPKLVSPSRVTPPRKAKQNKDSTGSVPDMATSPKITGKSSSPKTRGTSATLNMLKTPSSHLVNTNTMCMKPNGPFSSPKRPVGETLLSRKRKEFTPVKSFAKSNSPCRKIARKCSPLKKFSVDQIYVDPETNVNTTDVNGMDTPVNIGKGLREQNMNTGSIVNDPSKQGMCKSKESKFKVPEPVPSNNKIVNSRRSFTTSTPVSRNSHNNFNQSKTVSPVLQPQSSALQQNTPCQKSMGQSTTLMFKTPGSTMSYSSSISNPSFSSSMGNNSGLKSTPPLCNCGRRSKRRMVQSPGQNMGRFFFSCAVKKSVASKDGCKFFKWEIVSSGNVNSFTSSISNRSSFVSKQFTPVVRNTSHQTSYMSQKRCLGVRSSSFNTAQKGCLR